MEKLFSFIILLLWCNIADAQIISLTKDGKSAYTIIIPGKPTHIEVQAAKVLQDYIHRISEVTIPLADDQQKQTAHEVWIGKVNRKDAANINYNELGTDGILIKTIGQYLCITGGDRKGILYAVYTFLEDHLGCRKYTSTLTYIPKQKNIRLNALHDKQVPAFAYRETFYHDVFDPEFMDWHKLHSFEGRGGDKSQWGSWVHTFHNLLDPKEYGETHPEYFSFYDGQRHAGLIPNWDKTGVQPEAQLCLSNPDVLEIVCNNLKLAMDKKPEALYWSVSQNDNVNYCQCEKCAAIDKQYAAFTPEEKMYSTHGGEKYPALGSGSILAFVNKVADRFPDKIISTLAYQYSRVPPKDILPRKNVNIMLCSIESTRNETLEAGDTAFASDLKGWGKITNNILVWDYTIRFSNLLAPFPNLRILQPNIQFFRKNNVSALFEQGNIQSGGEMAPLRAYLITKMLWNPYIDSKKTENEFLNKYYGPAAQYIKQYIHLLHDHNQTGKEIKMSIFGNPVQDKETFLTTSLIAQYNAIFDKAVQSVKHAPELLDRVQSARLPVYYAMLEIARDTKTGDRGAFITGADGRLVPNPKMVTILYEFAYHCIKTKVSRTAEWHTTPKEYLEKYLAFLAQP